MPQVQYLLAMREPLFNGLFCFRIRPACNLSLRAGTECPNLFLKLAKGCNKFLCGRDVKELLKTLKPYGNPGEQNLIDAVNALLDGQTPLEQLRHFLTPAQQTRFETLQMVIAALQAMN